MSIEWANAVYLLYWLIFFYEKSLRFGFAGLDNTIEVDEMPDWGDVYEEDV